MTNNDHPFREEEQKKRQKKDQKTTRYRVALAGGTDKPQLRAYSRRRYQGRDTAIYFFLAVLITLFLSFFFAPLLEMGDHYLP
jgi:hypothetical protein